MPNSIQLTLTGREAAPQLPPLLRSATRSAGQPDDPFLPQGYLQPRATFDVTATARGTPEGIAEKRHDAVEDELVVLELADAPADRSHVVLQRLQLAGVADCARVEPLLGLGGTLVERGDLVLEALLTAAELAMSLIDCGDLGVDRRQLLGGRRELGPLRQRVAPARQLHDTNVVVLDCEERLPSTH
jgi:hypothetical protein